MELLGGKIENILEYQLPDSDINRSLLLIRKEKIHRRDIRERQVRLRRNHCVNN